MRPAENIEELIKALRYEGDGETHKRILANALQALDESQEQKLGPIGPERRKTIMNSRITRTAAAIVIVVGVFLGICYITRDTHSSVAFADVVRQMQQVRAATWTEVYEILAPYNEENVFVDGLGHVAQCAYKAPGRWRLDMTSTNIRGETKDIEESKCIQIWDFNAGKGLVLDLEKMTASPCSYEPDHGRDYLFRTFLSPKADIPADAEPLGTKQVAGREAVGFRIRLKGDGTDFLMGDVSEIWVDAKTKRLVLAETHDVERRWVSTLKDFIFDQELDDSLFSPELPEGYKDIGPLRFMWLEPSEAK